MLKEAGNDLFIRTDVDCGIDPVDGEGFVDNFGRVFPVNGSDRDGIADGENPVIISLLLRVIPSNVKDGDKGGEQPVNSFIFVCGDKVYFSKAELLISWGGVNDRCSSMHDDGQL